MPPRFRRTLAAGSTLVATAALALVPAAPASASWSCATVGNVLQVELDGEDVAIAVDAGTGAITANGGQCDSASVTTIDEVEVRDSSTGNATATIDLGGGAFAPGLTPEGTSSDEIEFDVDLGPGSADVLAVQGAGGSDTLVVGDLGANLNPAEADGADADVPPPTATERFVLRGAGGSDTLSSEGGSATGGAAPTAALEGGPDDDTLDGGAGNDDLAGDGGADQLDGDDGNDVLRGGTENDALDGGAGSDLLAGDLGADTFVGGSGFDTADYSDRTAVVRVNIDGLANDGATGELDDVGGTVEEVLGGSGNDKLTGSTVANTLIGAAGRDTLVGNLGDDSLEGGAGNDTLNGSGGDDRLEGGVGNDKENGQGADDVFEQNPWQKFEGPAPVAIPDKFTDDCLSSKIVSAVTLGPGQIRDINVRVDVEHQDIKELNIYLRAPTSTSGQPKTLVMVSDPPRNGTEFTGTTFDSEAVHRITETNVRPYDGRFHPEGSFDINLRGVDSAGTWELWVCDDVADGKTGVLNWWQLEIAYTSGAADGDDTLIGGGSSGGQHDLVNYAGRTANLMIDMDGATDCDGQGIECDLLTADLEDMYSGTGSDTIGGNDLENDLRGHQGNDGILGFASADKFRGGNGNDTIDAGPGDDQNINGNDGEDFMDGGTGNDRADGGSGNDLCPRVENKISCS